MDGGEGIHGKARIMALMTSQPVPPPTAMVSPLPGLMARVVTGDTAAFNQLARALQGPGLRLADRTLNDRAAAEDVVQVALTRMWTMAERFDASRGSVEGWFRRIVINLCLDRRRSIRLVAPLEAADQVASDAPDPYAAAVASDQRTRLDAAMVHQRPASARRWCCSMATAAAWPRSPNCSMPHPRLSRDCWAAPVLNYATLLEWKAARDHRSCP